MMAAAQAQQALRAGDPLRGDAEAAAASALMRGTSMDVAHEPIARLTDRLRDVVSDVIDEFCADTEWDGEMHNLARWWVAPRQWRGLEALGGIQYARFAFALTPAVEDEGDRPPISAPSGPARRRAMLRWEREVAGSAHRFAKFVAKQRDAVAQLAAFGFERADHLGPSFHLPLLLDHAALANGVAGDDIAKAVAPIAAVLRVAHAAAATFEPLVDWTREQLD